MSSATWKAGNICPSLKCAELLEHVLGANLWRLPCRQQCALILKVGTIERAGGWNCTPGPEIATEVRQWRLIRGRLELAGPVHGQKVVDRAFLLGALLVGLIFAASVLKLLIQRRLARR